jgi:hypothetical protein
MNSRLFSFVGGAVGNWRVTRMAAVVGDGLASVPRLNVVTDTAEPDGAAWVLRGITSNERYVTRAEKTDLVAKQEALGRPTSVCAALIPIKKNNDWWNLSQDERRNIFEAQSAHVKTGLMFLPAIARRLHHCRDLGSEEPFDFLTWFEYSPADSAAFDDLVAQLRASPEWKFVTREIDIRLELNRA